MKKLPLITKALLILLILNLSCSTEAIEEFQESNINQNENELQSRSEIMPDRSQCDNTVYVFVEYDFYVSLNGVIIELSPLLQAQAKANFRTEMSEHFTICEITNSTCNFYDRWSVSKDEYDAYISSNGDGPIRGTGLGGGQIKPRGGQANPNDQDGVACVFPF